LKHVSIARLIARVSVTLLATLVMFGGPALAKPNGNHGAAVSTAAHCPIKGQAHGKLVSSIAKNKAATVADAEAACAAAIAPPAPPAEPCPEPPADGTTPPADGTTPPADGTEPPADGTTPPPDGTSPPTDGTTALDACVEPPAEGDPTAVTLSATGGKTKVKGKGKGKNKKAKKGKKAHS
jgi:hypothetical protein